MIDHTRSVSQFPVSPSRPRMSLDGAWDFQFEGERRVRQAFIPSPWQAQFEDLRSASGTATYRKGFKIPKNWKGSLIAVHFGAVSYFAQVYLNGHYLGSHEGGYLPFEFVLPEDLLADYNEMEVRATAPSEDRDKYPDFPFSEIPHGKQSWYGAIGGIWQSVHVEARNPVHVEQLRIRASSSGLLKADLSITSRRKAAARINVLDPSGISVWQHDFEVTDGTASIVQQLHPVSPWAPESPDLYRMTVEIHLDGKLTDQVSDTFGFRTFETMGGKFFLNGEPFYMRAVLDQDYYPDGIFTPPSTEFLEDQLRKAKSLGFNMLRCHIKVPDPRYLEVADRLGMLVWAETPNVEIFSERSSKRLRQTLEGMLVRDGNRPSIVAWTIINEDWGIRLRESQAQRDWLVSTFDWLKGLDPDRLVVDNSPCAPNYHLKSDINDFHYYRSLPERRDEWDALTEEFATGPDWAYSPFGDAQRTGEEPLVVSEFGVWGLPHLDPLRADGKDPWWFGSGAMWGDGAGQPLGVEARFQSTGLTKVFGSFHHFVECAQWYQFENLKYEIETIRAQGPISGYVVTELSDVHWEANGLLDMNRNPRIFAARFAEINSETIIVPCMSKWSFVGGEEMNLEVKVATGGLALDTGCKLSWRMAGESLEGAVDIKGIDPLTCWPLDAISIRLPEPAEPQMASILFEIRSPDNLVVASNRVTFALYPRRPALNATTSVASDDEELAARLDKLGYQVVDEARATVFVTRVLDARRVELIEGGQKVLLLAESRDGYARSDAPPREQPFRPIVDSEPGIPSQSYFFFPGFSVIDRESSIWRGDWITNFSWLERTGVFSGLPGGPMLDLTFDGVAPKAVMTGFRPWEFEGRVRAGVVAGWVGKPAATIVEKPHGAGYLVASTFELTAQPAGQNATATALIDALVKLTGARA